MRKTTLLITILMLVGLVLIGTGCKEKEPEKKGVTQPEAGPCLSNEEMFKLLPESWPAPWKEVTKRTPYGSDGCEGLEFAVGQVDEEGFPVKHVHLWIYDMETPAEAKSGLEFQVNNIMGGKEAGWQKTTYKGNLAYKSAGGLWIAAGRFEIQTVYGDLSDEELDLILGSLKVW